MTRLHGKSPLDTLEYFEDTETYRATFDEEMSASIAVVTAIASATDSDPRRAAPLYEGLDTDALDTILSTATEPVVTVSFTYEECEVTASSDGVVRFALPGSIQNHS